VKEKDVTPVRISNWGEEEESRLCVCVCVCECCQTKVLLENPVTGSYRKEKKNKKRKTLAYKTLQNITAVDKLMHVHCAKYTGCPTR
jgi:hypothetical protein